jgi:antitoxin PrlF
MRTEWPVKPDARRIRGLLKSPHTVTPSVAQMDDAVSKHLRNKHTPMMVLRKPVRP